MNFKSVLRSGAAIVSLVSLAACGIRPHPMTMEENITRAMEDKGTIGPEPHWTCRPLNASVQGIFCQQGLP